MVVEIGNQKYALEIIGSQPRSRRKAAIDFMIDYYKKKNRLPPIRMTNRAIGVRHTIWPAKGLYEDLVRLGIIHSPPGVALYQVVDWTGLQIYASTID